MLQNNFVHKVFFKNTKELLDPILLKHAAGEIETPSELETIMLSEAEELIRNRLDNLKGAI